MVLVDCNHYLVEIPSRMEVTGSTTGFHYYFGVGGDSSIPAVPKIPNTKLIIIPSNAYVTLGYDMFDRQISVKQLQ